MSSKPAKRSKRWLPTVLIAAGVGLVAATYLYTRATAMSDQDPLSTAWYTDDDGKTWFAGDQRELIPPFDRLGKTAYRAYLFTSDGGKTRFVGYLERYTPEAAKLLAGMRTPKVAQPPIPGQLRMIQSQGLEFKKPGDRDWINARDPKAASVRNVKDAKPLEMLP